MVWIDTCNRLLTTIPSPLLETVNSRKGERSFGCTRLSNKPKLQPLWVGFCQRQNCKIKPSFADATSTVSFFCNRRQKPVLRRRSAPNSPTETWESCSEWIIWPEFSHCCGKFGSWFQKLPVSLLTLSFQLSKLNVLDVAVNSGDDRFDDHLIQSNNISGSKISYFFYELF